MHLAPRPFAALAASALGASLLLLGAPAQAAPVFLDLDTHLDPQGGVSSSGINCTVVAVGDNTPNVPVVENGPAASATASSSATYGNTGTPSDTATWAGQATATGKITSIAGNPDLFDFSATGSDALVNALGTSADCYRGGYAGVDLDFSFTVTQAGILHLSLKNTGPTAYSEVYVFTDMPGGSKPYVEHYGYDVGFNGTTDVLLPPGTYHGYFEGEGIVSSKTSKSGTWSTTVHGDFNPVGSQTEAVAGKGKKYVALPSVRSCATHDVATSVTGKKKRAGQVKQVTFLVNDVKVKKVKTPKKGAKISLPIADDQAADVVAQVELVSKTKGKPGKVVEVSSSYEACS